ncbi:Six-hairpin glycosidase-like protein [Lactifluus subvellereus]|nr:Six-hairpin glycosidase-like protein [Lactifluus subvellereus]
MTAMYISSIKIAQHILLLLASLSTATAQGFTQIQIDTVVQRLQEGATHSWELGTRAQALLELSVPHFSVLTPSVLLPPPSSLNSSDDASLADVLTIARNAVAALPPPPQNGTGQPLFLGDGSAGDPASVGMAVLLANWTGQPGDEDYAGAATAQVEYLLGPAVPKTSDGAISHRVSQLQLWSDFVYMVPPFLAYYGVTTSNQSMLQEAYEQIRLYRSYLSDASANGLWRHIVLGSGGLDPGHWSTGNAWAAAGMLRVLGTLKSSPSRGSFNSQIEDLGDWVAEIHGAMYPHLQPNGLFKNYADGTGNASTNFDDASSSALLAATVYRLVHLTGKGGAFIPQAERTRAAILAALNSPGSATSSSPAPPSTPSPTRRASSSASSDAQQPRFSSDGWLAPVVDPLNISVEGARSPEGEAFVLMLYAAWRDWSAAAGSAGEGKSNGGAVRLGGDVRRVHLGVAAGLVVLVASCTMGDLSL